jgi:hypothetical protein
MLVHLSLGVQWKLSCIMSPLTNYLVYPYESKIIVSMTMLSSVGYR